MDFNLSNKLFIVTGAGGGFGRAIAEALLNEGARVIAVARTASVLAEFQSQWPDSLETICADITQTTSQEAVMNQIKGRFLSGVLVNAGGPPAGSFDELNPSQWDEAYRTLIQWKVNFTRLIMPVMQRQQFGRLLYIESVSVKQAVENLLLSNTFRPAMVGFVKSLSQEMASQQITMNILAPGYHETDAMQRLFVKKSDMLGISIQEAKKVFTDSIPVGRMGKANELASLALWLLSDHSAFVTGQTISHDGGTVKGFFG